jgi:hypothetical protein
MLKMDPKDWRGKPEFEIHLNLKSVRSLKVLNDGAERGIALVSELNSKPLTRNEDEFQKIIQIIEHNRRRYPGVSKSILNIK